MHLSVFIDNSTDPKKGSVFWGPVCKQTRWCETITGFALQIRSLTIEHFKSDRVARAVGDEFIAIIYNCDNETAASTRSRIQLAINDRNNVPDSLTTNNLSIGSATSKVVKTFLTILCKRLMN